MIMGEQEVHFHIHRSKTDQFGNGVQFSFEGMCHSGALSSAGIETILG